jgi:ABC-type transporter Mla subunit MlaD
VVVEALVREDVRIPTGVQAQASQPLIGGSATLRLRVPPEATDGYISRTDAPMIQGQTEPLSAQLANEVRQTLQRPINRFDSLADELEALSSQWTEVGSNVNRLVSPRRPEKVDGNGDLGPNVSTLVQRIDARMRQLGKTLEDVQSLTGDEQVIDDFRRTLANARKLSGKLDGRIDRISHEITRTSEALRKRYVAVADDLSQAVRSMNRLTDRARQGDGTIGRRRNAAADGKMEVRGRAGPVLSAGSSAFATTAATHPYAGISSTTNEIRDRHSGWRRGLSVGRTRRPHTTGRGPNPEYGRPRCGRTAGDGRHDA